MEFKPFPMTPGELLEFVVYALAVVAVIGFAVWL